MKTIKYLFLTVAAPLLLGGCESLETQPTDRVINEYFWQTDDDAIMAVNGAYNKIAASDYMYLDCATDLFWNQTSWGDAHLLGNGSQDAEMWNWTSKKWKAAYEMIQRCNYVLENIDLVPNMKDDLKNRLCAEVRFLRAMMFSDISFLWGDVPLTKTTLDIKNAEMSRTPHADVIDFIIKELKDIDGDLPESYPSADVGRVTRGAARAMLMRVYMRENMYAEAKVAAKSVMDMGKYDIYPSYENLFRYAGENCEEVIFDKQFVSTTYKHDYPKRLVPLSCLNGTDNIVPLQGLVDAYQMLNGKFINEEGSGFDPYNPYENRDLRLKATVLTPGAVMQNGEIFNSLPGQGTDAVDSGNSQVSRTGFNITKYVNPEDLAESNTNCHNNFILIRYAEVLLSYAEAKVETNDIDQSVYDAINKIRTRAGLPLITAGKSQQELIDIIRQERKVEFPLEGVRYFDIRRWKIAEDVMPGQTYGMTYPDANGQLVTVRAEMRRFNPARDYLWPVPFRERNVNKNLTQNPNY